MGNISVSIPYTLSENEREENVVVYYIDGNGKTFGKPDEADLKKVGD